jgi:hypothetical protein
LKEESEPNPLANRLIATQDDQSGDNGNGNDKNDSAENGDSTDV